MSTPQAGSGWPRAPGLFGDRLYYSAPELDDWEATLVASEEGGRLLELDRTLFYPEGGGQPCDLGSLDGLPLLEVVEIEGRILHRLASPLAKSPSDSVALRLDRDRRRDHTEQHSAQHLLSGIASRERGFQTKSFHLGPETSTIDLEVDGLDEAALSALEREANAAIGRNLAFILHACGPEEAALLPLRKAPPAEEKLIRIVEIEGLDFSPCCGTHVRSALTLRLVKILSGERYKGMTRLSFVAGGRALAAFDRLHRSARAASRILSAPPEDLGPGAEGLSLRLREAHSSAKLLLKRLVSLEIEGALASGGPGRPLSITLEGCGPEGLDEALAGFASRKLTGLAVLPELHSVAAGGLLPETRQALAEAALALGGRGGGGKTAYRAAFPGKEPFEAFLAAVRTILEP